MQEQDPLEQHIYDLILELCAVLYAHGYRAVPMGAIMRMIGVADQHAQEHDGKMFELDQDFERTLKQKQRDFSLMDDQVPPGVTLH
jgi:hypothetical protein